MQIEGRRVKAQIWDTAGQERYRAITSAYVLVNFMDISVVFDLVPGFIRKIHLVFSQISCQFLCFDSAF